MPSPLPSWLLDCHVTTNPPPASAATDGLTWLSSVIALTMNSPPSGVPSSDMHRAYTPHPLPSCKMDIHVTTEPPPSSAAIEGVCCVPAVVLFTSVSPPTALMY